MLGQSFFLCDEVVAPVYRPEQIRSLPLAGEAGKDR